MNDESTGVNRDYPTKRGTAGRPHGRDDTTDPSSSSKTPPRSNAAARTGGYSRSEPRPVEPSARDVDNTTDPSSDYLTAVLKRAPQSEGSFFHGGGA